MSFYVFLLNNDWLKIGCCYFLIVRNVVLPKSMCYELPMYKKNYCCQFEVSRACLSLYCVKTLLYLLKPTIVLESILIAQLDHYHKLQVQIFCRLWVIAISEWRVFCLAYIICYGKSPKHVKWWPLSYPGRCIYFV